VFRSKPARKPAPGTKREHHDPNERCHARSCPRCARIRAANYRDFGARVAKLFDTLCDRQMQEWGSWRYRARHVVLTVGRDVADPAEHTAVALRERREGLRRAWRAILAWLRDTNPRAEWIGAFVSDECQGTGHVHLHVLFHGPWVKAAQGEAPAEWTEIGRAGYTDARRIHWPGYERLGYIKPRGIVGAVAIAEVAKYPLKTPGSGKHAESWIAGQRRLVMHPRLVARWEIATFGARLVERYGIVREVPPPDNDGENDGNEETEIPAPPREPCPWCGCCETKIVLFETADFLALARVHRRRDRVRFSAFGGESANAGAAKG
jgi:hypothetical protein